jgi:23S rRNA (uracil1939-C5)-methyltransferase
MVEQYKIQIQSLVYGGSGLARLPEGSAVFVPFTLPGEEVVIRIREKKRNYSLADLIEVIKPHPDRIVPVCSHFGICGGCHYQHLPYKMQIEFKKQIFIEQLQRLARTKVMDFHLGIPSPLERDYRNTLQFQLNEFGDLCYSRHADNTLLKIRECHLPMPAINQTWQQLSFNEPGDLERIEVRQNQDDEVLVLLIGRSERIPAMDIGSTVSIVHTSQRGHVVVAGDDALMMQVSDKIFQVSALSFFQVNPKATEKMAALINEWVISWQPELVMDLYCGVGLFSAFIAPEVKKIVAVESSSSACSDYAVNLDEYDHIELYEGLAEQILPVLNQKPDLVIVDPPRGGIHKDALNAIVKNKPKVIIYVSCDPATLARDLLMLIKNDYALTQSALIDMFPQTFHIESVNMFVRAD